MSTAAGLPEGMTTEALVAAARRASQFARLPQRGPEGLERWLQELLEQGIVEREAGRWRPSSGASPWLRRFEDAIEWWLE